MFSDENFNISPLKKHISSSEHNFVKDLIKTMDLKKKILIRYLKDFNNVPHVNFCKGH